MQLIRLFLYIHNNSKHKINNRCENFSRELSKLIKKYNNLLMGFNSNYFILFIYTVLIF